MSTSAQWSEAKNPKTGMTQAEMKEFIRNHFEQFVNRKNLHVGEVNFAPNFVDHGADAPQDCLPDPRALYSTSARRSKKFRTCG